MVEKAFDPDADRAVPHHNWIYGGVVLDVVRLQSDNCEVGDCGSDDQFDALYEFLSEGVLGEEGRDAEDYLWEFAV